MPVIVEGGLHSPPARSKLDMSEGQKNRLAREAMQFLKRIEDELSHELFSFDEILEEGVGGSFSAVTDNITDAQREQFVTRYLGFLITNGYVEIVGDDEKTYRLVEEKLGAPIPYEPWL